MLFSQRLNIQHEEAGLAHCRLFFVPYPKEVPHVVRMPCGLKRHTEQETKPCHNYGVSGIHYSLFVLILSCFSVG